MVGTAGRRAAKGWLFISPWVLGFLVFSAGPMLISLALSFTKYDLHSMNFVGVENYRRLFFEDPLFWKSLSVTVIYAFVSVPLGILCSLGLALLLNVDVRGQRLFRTLFYLPSVVPAVASALVWLWMFDANHGPINRLLGFFGFAPVAWLQDQRFTLGAFVIMSLWGVGGGRMIIFPRRASSGIPESYYEAAPAGRRRHLETVPKRDAAAPVAGHLFQPYPRLYRRLSGVHLELCDDVRGAEQRDAVLRPLSVPQLFRLLQAWQSERAGVGPLRDTHGGHRSPVLGLASMGVLRGGPGVKRPATYAALVGLGALCLLPLLWTLSIALKSAQEYAREPGRLIPHHPAWDNFSRAWTELPFAPLRGEHRLHRPRHNGRPGRRQFDGGLWFRALQIQGAGRRVQLAACYDDAAFAGHDDPDLSSSGGTRLHGIDTYFPLYRVPGVLWRRFQYLSAAPVHARIAA